MPERTPHTPRNWAVKTFLRQTCNKHTSGQALFTSGGQAAPAGADGQGLRCQDRTVGEDGQGESEMQEGIAGHGRGSGREVGQEADKVL